MLRKNSSRVLPWWGILIIFVGLVGCAAHKKPLNPRDPYENFNRKVFAFNMACDHAFIQPVAKVYDMLLPWEVRKGVHNFFGNIGDITSAANEILQFDFSQAIVDLARVVINSTIGFGGIFDVATHMGIERDVEDFGLTLAHWGAKDTPYLVLPFLGPSTIRDTIGVAINQVFLNPINYIHAAEWRYSLQGLYFIERRATLLMGDKVIDQAFDPYIFVRDAYIQRRDYLADERNQRRVEKYVSDYGVVHRRTQTLKPSRILPN